MHLDDTIVAISSAAGPAPRMIVRASGPEAPDLSAQLCALEKMPPGNGARRHTIYLSKDIYFPAWIWRFISPQSYTGQHLIEWHLPGNPLLSRMLLDRLIEMGARSAEPGEFTARAYFNGKLDLTQAEGVAASIGASNAGELNGARQLMAGELSRRLRPVMDLLLETISLVEVGIDFSEEDVEFLSSIEIKQRLADIGNQLQLIVSESTRFEKLSHEPTIVFAGRPNAGKSTLTNALAGRERSIVSPTAGTTRDALVVEATLKRGIVRLIDVAGLEESSAQSSVIGDIEKQMQSHAERAMEEADVLILVTEMGDERKLAALPRDADLVVYSKMDLFPTLIPSPRTKGEGSFFPRAEDPHPKPLPVYREGGPEGEMRISAISGLNMDQLRTKLDALAFGSESPAAKLALGARHLRAIEEAQTAMQRARESSHQSPELLAADLRESLDALGQILGQITPDDILGKIFSTFCIGK